MCDSVERTSFQYAIFCYDTYKIETETQVFSVMSVIYLLPYELDTMTCQTIDMYSMQWCSFV